MAKGDESDREPRFTRELDAVFVAEGGARLGKKVEQADTAEIDELVSQPVFEVSESTRAVDVEDLPKKEE